MHVFVPPDQREIYVFFILFELCHKLPLPVQSHNVSMLSHPQNHSWKRHFQHFGPITLPKDTLTCSSGGIRISNHQPMDNWMTRSSS